MEPRPEKILVLQFKYFGDAVLMTPALRALRTHFRNAELHLLVPAEMAPLFQHLPWLTRVWAMPRRRGSASLHETWPLIRALRRERFDRSVDFASNDRGAILSFLIGAQCRLGWAERGGFIGRRFFYTDRVTPGKKLSSANSFPNRSSRREEAPISSTNEPRHLGCYEATLGSHESVRLARLLSGWQIPPPSSLEAEIRADETLAEAARNILSVENAIVCHVASSQPKKEWPLKHWARFHQLATAAGWRLVFTTARGEREAALMQELKRLVPEAVVLPPILELPLFLAVLARAGIFISGDTGPLHFAAGLRVPTISLFGPSAPARWAPVGRRHRCLTGNVCTCDGNLSVCQSSNHCLATISPEQVFACLQDVLAESKRH